LQLRNTILWTAIGLAMSLVSCSTSFDMSGERLTPLGPEWGVVIGSVLVQPVKAASGEDAMRRDAADMTYEFDIVQSPPGDPDGESPYAERYHLDARAGEERIFISRLRSGQYLIKTFSQARMTGIGGNLDLMFASMAGEVRYIGRVLVEIPQRVSHGKGYRFTVENARESTLGQVSHHHADLANQAVDAPMQARARPEP
jgi:hypothetical protein